MVTCLFLRLSLGRVGDSWATRHPNRDQVAHNFQEGMGCLGQGLQCIAFDAPLHAPVEASTVRL
jgi:hypothetical protein